MKRERNLCLKNSNLLGLIFHRAKNNNSISEHLERKYRSILKEICLLEAINLISPKNTSIEGIFFS